MPLEIRVPSLGESVVEATVASWRKQEGEAVTVGEPLVELETDKVNTELSADDTGVLSQILHRKGDTVHPGDVLGLIAAGAPEADGHAAAAPAAQAPAPPAPAPEPAAAPPPTVEAPTAVAPERGAEAPPGERVRASPVAQRLAESLQVDLALVPGTGAGGRVTKEDVEA